MNRRERIVRTSAVVMLILYGRVSAFFPFTLGWQACGAVVGAGVGSLAAYLLAPTVKS
jgi:membrane associated rhomboid family serine protease